MKGEYGFERITLEHSEVLTQVFEALDHPYYWLNPVSAAAYKNLIKIEDGCVLLLRYACFGQYIAKLRIPPVSLSGNRDAENRLLLKYLNLGASCLTTSPDELPSPYGVRREGSAGGSETIAMPHDLSGMHFRRIRKQIHQHARKLGEGELQCEVLSAYPDELIPLFRDWCDDRWGHQLPDLDIARSLGPELSKVVVHYNKEKIPVHFSAYYEAGDKAVGFLTARDKSYLPKINLGAVSNVIYLKHSDHIRELNLGSSRKPAHRFSKDLINTKEVPIFRIRPAFKIDKEDWLKFGPRDQVR